MSIAKIKINHPLNKKILKNPLQKEKNVFLIQKNYQGNIGKIKNKIFQQLLIEINIKIRFIFFQIMLVFIAL